MGGGSSKPTAAPVQVETQVQAMAQSLIQSLQARQVALEAQSDSLDAFQVDQGQNYKTGLANLQNQLNIFNQGCSEMSNVLETQFNDFVQQILETADPVQIECLRAYYTLQSVLLYYEIWAYFVAAAAANHPNLLTDPNDAFFRPDARLAPLFEQFAQKSTTRVGCETMSSSATAHFSGHWIEC